MLSGNEIIVEKNRKFRQTVAENKISNLVKWPHKTENFNK